MGGTRADIQSPDYFALLHPSLMPHSLAPPPPIMPGIRDKINVFHFERDTMLRAGVTDCGTATPPFLVIASNDINEELGAGVGILTGSRSG